MLFDSSNRMHKFLESTSKGQINLDEVIMIVLGLHSSGKFPCSWARSFPPKNRIVCMYERKNEESNRLWGVVRMHKLLYSPMGNWRHEEYFVEQASFSHGTWDCILNHRRMTSLSHYGLFISMKPHHPFGLLGRNTICNHCWLTSGNRICAWRVFDGISRRSFFSGFCLALDFKRTCETCEQRDVGIDRGVLIGLFPWVWTYKIGAGVRITGGNSKRIEWIIFLLPQKTSQLNICCLMEFTERL